MLGLLENVSQAQAQNRTLLTIAVYLLRQGLQQGKVNQLRAELSHLVDTDQLISTLLPELASDIERLSGEDNA
nr:TraA [Pseudomonas putida]